MTYRIRRYSKRYKRFIYFAGQVDENNNHWVNDINESFIYLDKKECEKDLKKYKLKGVEIYGEE